MRNVKRSLILVILFGLGTAACNVTEKVGPSASSAPIVQDQPKDHRPDSPTSQDPQPLLRKFRSK